MPKFKSVARRERGKLIGEPAEDSSSSSPSPPPPPLQKRKRTMTSGGPSRQPSRHQQSSHPAPQDNLWRNALHEQRYFSRFSKAKIVEGRIINWNKLAVDGYNGNLKEWLASVDLLGLFDLPEAIYPGKIAAFYSSLILRREEIDFPDLFVESNLYWFCDGKEFKTTDTELGELLGIDGRGSSNISGGDRIAEIWTELSGMPCLPKGERGKVSAALLRSIDYRLLHHVVCSGLLSQPEGSYSTITQEEMLLIHAISSGVKFNFARFIIYRIKAAARSEKGHMLYGRVISKLIASQSELDSSKWVVERKGGIYTGTSLKKMDMEKHGGGWRWKPTHVDQVKSMWRTSLSKEGLPYSDRAVEFALGVRVMEEGEASGTAGVRDGNDTDDIQSPVERQYVAERRTKETHDQARGTWINRKLKKLFGCMKKIAKRQDKLFSNQKKLMEAQGLEFEEPSSNLQEESWTSSDNDAQT